MIDKILKILSIIFLIIGISTILIIGIPYSITEYQQYKQQQITQACFDKGGIYFLGTCITVSEGH